MAMTPEEIAAQFAAQQAAQAVQLEQQKAAEEAKATDPMGVRFASPAKTSAVIGSGGGGGYIVSPTIANAQTPAKGFTSPSGMPRTAFVTSVGYAPTGTAGGRGGGGLSSGSSGAAYSGGGEGGGEGGGGEGGGGGDEGMTQEEAIEENIAVNKGLEQVAPSNPLAREGGVLQNNLDAAAQNYRNLVSANASPEERAAAKQEYANALDQKATAVGNQPRTASQAFAAPQRETSSAEQSKIARYNAYLESQGINPQEIGTAQMNVKGGLDVLSIPQEREAKHLANQNAETYQQYVAAERHARRAARGLKGKEKDAAEESVVEAKLAKDQYGLQSGLINPKDPKAGMDMDNAERMARANLRLARDPSSLAGLAQKRIAQQQATEQRQPAAQQTAQQSQQAQAMQAEQARQLQEQEIRNRLWDEEQRRRQQQMFGNLYAQY